jgi:hypothetical protein
MSQRKKLGEIVFGLRDMVSFDRAHLGGEVFGVLEMNG